MSKKSKKFSQEQRYQITYNAMNRNQALLWQSFHENIITVAYGSAGTGKTTAACTYAALMTSKNYFNKIVLTRANVPTGRTLGAFPGTIEDKLYPWLAHLLNYLSDLLGKGTVDSWLRGEHPRIIMQPIETVRGSTFNNSIIIVDEAQQLLSSEIKALTTRIGTDSKMILTGDPMQKDIKEEGLTSFIEMVQRHNIPEIGIVKFNPDDCVRSDICQRLLKMYEEEEV